MISISASMINRAKATQNAITDFHIGSVFRTLIESPAIEIEEFYQRMFAGILEAIPTAIYRGFDFALIGPTVARGVVNINFGGPIAIPFTLPAGTIFKASAKGNTYYTLHDVDVPVGVTTISVLVESSQSGAAGNASYGAVDSVVNYDLPIGANVGNELINSGNNGETEEERKARFAHFVQTLQRGTNGAVEFAARMAEVHSADGNLVEYVSRTGFYEVPGTMDVYIYGDAGMASPELVAQAQKVVDGYWDAESQTFVAGYRPVGIRVRVFAMQELPIDAVFTVEMFSGIVLTDAIKNQILDALSYQITSIMPTFVLYVENLDNAVLSVPGVKAVRNNLSANVTCPFSMALVKGNIQIIAGDA
jgi:hypothetical protein